MYENTDDYTYDYANDYANTYDFLLNGKKHILCHANCTELDCASFELGLDFWFDTWSQTFRCQHQSP